MPTNLTRRLNLTFGCSNAPPALRSRSAQGSEERQKKIDYRESAQSQYPRFFAYRRPRPHFRTDAKLIWSEVQTRQQSFMSRGSPGRRARFRENACISISIVVCIKAYWADMRMGEQVASAALLFLSCLNPSLLGYLTLRFGPSYQQR